MGYWERVDEEIERIERLDPRRAGNAGPGAWFRRIAVADITYLLRQAPFFEDDLARRLRVKQGRLLAVLRRMEREGLVKYWDIQSGRPMRRAWTLVHPPASRIHVGVPCEQECP